jgi:hypothetical protein
MRSKSRPTIWAARPAVSVLDHQVIGEGVTTRSANLIVYNLYCSKENPRDRQNHRK